MMEKGKRDMVRTGTAVLGATLMVMALAASPVGAIPFEGEETGQFWFVPNSDSNGDGFHGIQLLPSGWSTFAGASQCILFIEYQLAPAPAGNCDGVEFSLVPGGWAACQTEESDGVMWMQVVDATSCSPLSCFDANNNIVVGCTGTARTEFNILGGTGMYTDATGHYTTTGTFTYTTTFSGTFSLDTTGDITLAGDAPPNDVFLDIPSAGSTQSGIGVVSGWSCLGGHLEATFSEADGSPISTWTIPHGASRGDTQDACGDSDNGFSMPLNWYHLGPGEKTLTLFVNGEERVTQNFFVTTFGEEFVTGAEGMCTIADFPEMGKNATFVWEQSQQGLVLEALN